MAEETPAEAPASEAQEGGQGFAIIALILAIASLVLILLNPYISIIAGIFAVVIGMIARKKPAGAGLATIGLVLGVIAIVIRAVKLAGGSDKSDVREQREIEGQQDQDERGQRQRRGGAFRLIERPTQLAWAYDGNARLG